MNTDKNVTVYNKNFLYIVLQYNLSPFVVHFDLPHTFSYTLLTSVNFCKYGYLQVYFTF